VRDFANATRYWPTDDLARSYWSDYAPQKISPDVTEVLADSALYLPDWANISVLDFQVTARWDAARRGRTAH